jgi:WD40 repeat protein
VSVWDVDTGEKIMQFSHCHGNVEITAMGFDTAGRRLVTGARDGSMKIWNFNNGACLSVLQTKHNVEVKLIYNINLQVGMTIIIKH